jgi:hypothetical protein
MNRNPELDAELEWFGQLVKKVDESLRVRFLRDQARRPARAFSRGLEVTMVKKGARRSLALGCVRYGRIAARLAGSIATMILGAIALGGAIAGVGIVILGEAGSGGAQSRVLAGLQESVAAAKSDELMEARSAWVGGKVRSVQGRHRRLGAGNGSWELDVEE